MGKKLEAGKVTPWQDPSRSYRGSTLLKTLALHFPRLRHSLPGLVHCSKRCVEWRQLVISSNLGSAWVPAPWFNDYFCNIENTNVLYKIISNNWNYQPTQ